MDDANIIIEFDDGFMESTIVQCLQFEWFRTMLQSGMSEAHKKVVRLNGFRKEAMKRLFELKKNNSSSISLNMSVKDAALVFTLAHYLAENNIVEEAKKLVENNANVTKESFVGMFSLSVQMDLQELKKKCVSFGLGVSNDLGKCSHVWPYQLPVELFNKEGKVNSCDLPPH